MEDEKRVTLRQIAQKAGVSVSTVSRFINNSAGLSDDVRTAVEHAYNELSYKPPKTLRLGKKIIAYILPDSLNPFFSELTKGVVSIAEMHNIDVLVYDTDDDLEFEHECIKKAMAFPVDGIILIPTSNTKTIDIEVFRRHIPIVTITELVEPSDQLSGIFADNIDGAYQAVRYLTSLGHEKILHVTGNLNSSISKNRLEGYRNALTSSGIEYREELVISCGYQYRDICDAMTQAIESKTIDFSAIFAFNDFMALASISVLHKHKKKVPDDVSVVGYDDIIYADAFGLTTVSQPILNMGKSAATMMIDLLQHKNNRHPKTVFKPGLVIRDSCKVYTP